MAAIPKTKLYEPLYKEENDLRMLVKVAYKNGDLIRLLKRRGDMANQKCD